ncbi:hypothetical protein J3A83DRAFT_4186239 [Scleroderma citrinum]
MLKDLSGMNFNWVCSLCAYYFTGTLGKFFDKLHVDLSIDLTKPVRMPNLHAIICQFIQLFVPKLFDNSKGRSVFFSGAITVDPTKLEEKQLNNGLGYLGFNGVCLLLLTYALLKFSKSLLNAFKAQSKGVVFSLDVAAQSLHSSPGCYGLAVTYTSWTSPDPLQEWDPKYNSSIEVPLHWPVDWPWKYLLVYKKGVFSHHCCSHGRDRMALPVGPEKSGLKTLRKGGSQRSCGELEGTMWICSSTPSLGALWCQGLCRVLEGVMGTCGIVALLESLCGYMLVYCWLRKGRDRGGG